jgi:nitrate/TMAO reductase-like tetraheme cytochrome c subunit
MGCKGIVITVALLGIGAGLAAAAGIATVVDYTGTTEFCISCHEMRSTVYQEYIDTSHYKNAAGVRASCGDCHYPEHNWIELLSRKTTAGARDIYHHLRGTIATREKFEARRKELAEMVWARMESNDSLACRNCHSKVQSDAMDLAKQRRRAMQEHRDAVDEKLTCIDCHKGIAHKPVHEEQESEEQGFAL